MYAVSFVSDYHWLNDKAVDILWIRDWDVLKKMFPKIADKKDLSKEILISEMEQIFLKNASFFQERCIFYQKEWLLFEQKWQRYLKQFFGIKAPQKTITAALTLLPLYPRDLKQNCFLLPVRDDSPNAQSVIAHELTHFYYYDVLGFYEKDLCITDSKKWVLSEMLIPFLFRDFYEKTGHQFCCSAYLFKKETLERCFPVFKNSWQSEKPFWTFLKDMEKINFSQHDLHVKFLQD